MESLRDGLLNIALKFGTGVGKNGAPYEWLIDSRELLLQGPYLQQAARLLWDKVKAYRPEVVAGMTTAANPLTIALMYESRADGEGVQGVIIRKEPKVDGLRKLLEGPDLKPGTRVVLVDDLINSGDTQRQALEVLTPTGCEVVAIAVLVDYQRSGSKALQADGYPVVSLFTFGDLGMGVGTPRDQRSPSWTWGPLNSGSYDAPKSTPWIGQGRVVVGSDKGFLVALSQAGQELWRVPVRNKVRGIHGTPAVHQGKVYVGAYDGFLYCIDLETGQKVWDVTYCQWIGSSPAVNEADGLVYVGIERGEAGGGLMAVEADNGKLSWEMPATDYVHSSPVYDVARGQVLVGSNDTFVYAAEARSGQKRWEYRTGGAIKGKPALDADGTCFVGSFDGFLYALDATDGSLRWKRKLASALYTTPLVAGDLVVAGGYSSRIVAMDRRSGHVRWVATTNGRIVGGAAPVPGGVVVPSTDGSIYALSGEDGSLQWTYRTQGAIMGTPGVGDHLLVVPSFDGSLYAFPI